MVWDASGAGSGAAGMLSRAATRPMTYREVWMRSEPTFYALDAGMPATDIAAFGAMCEPVWCSNRTAGTCADPAWRPAHPYPDFPFDSNEI